MRKKDQPAWVKRILKLLEQAKAKDSDEMVFGADDHHYELNAPASEKTIQAFEEYHGIRLPEEYRDFLLLVGNGGAGPYYGLYSVYKPKKGEDKISVPDKTEPVIHPKMSDEEWDRVADPLGRRKGENRNPYAGVLPIGTQGCTLMTGLMVAGPYYGQVVYYDEDLCGPPFFVREKGFLAWYERWLREAIAGYNDEEQGFGIYVDGNPQQLMELYQQTEDLGEKIEILESYHKFETLPEEQKTFFKQTCAQETNMELRMYLVKLLARFHVPGLEEELEKLWEYGAYGEAISVITYEGGWEVKEKWYERILEKLPELQGEAFRNACFVIRTVKDFPNIHAGRLRDSLYREDLGRNERLVLFNTIKELRGKDEVKDYFLEYIPIEENPDTLIYAIWAMESVKDRQLQEIYVRLLDKYKTHENAQLDYKGSQMVLKDGSCLGAKHPEGQLVSNLMRQFDNFGLDYRGAWKLLMSGENWMEWKRKNGFGDENQ